MFPRITVPYFAGSGYKKNMRGNQEKAITF